MAAIQDTTLRFDAVLAGLFGSGQPIGQQLQQAQAILQTLRNEDSQNSSPFANGGWDLIVQLAELILSHCDRSVSFYQLNETLKEAEELLRVLAAASEKSAEDARKWCEEYLQDETFCTMLKNFLMPWKKEDVDEQVSSWEKALKEDSLKTIDDMKKGIQEARCNYIHDKIQWNILTCVISVAVSVYYMYSDVTTVRAYKKELESIDAELSSIEKDINELGSSIITVVMEMIQNKPLREPLPMIILRASDIRRRALACTGKLTEQQKHLKERKNDHWIKAGRNIATGLLKYVEVTMTRGFVSPVMNVINHLIMTGYSATGFGHLGVAVSCHNVLVEVEARLQKGQELQLKLEKELKDLMEWINAFPQCCNHQGKPAIN